MIKRFVMLLAGFGAIALGFFVSIRSIESEQEFTDLPEIERISGSRFCAPNGAVAITSISPLSAIKPRAANSAVSAEEQAATRRTILENFPNSEYPCIDLGAWGDQLLSPDKLNYHKNTGFTEIDGSKVPLIVTRRYGSHLSFDHYSGTIFVRISGGPGGVVFQPLNDFAIGLGETDLLIDLIYSGSGVNLRYPLPNFELASREIAIFVRQLRQINEEAKIVLVGESLGGLLVLSALQLNSTHKVDKVILLSPQVMAPDDFLQNERQKLNASSTKNPTLYYRAIDSKVDDWSSRNIVELDPLEVYLKFFEPENFELALTDRIAEIKGYEILIIYGNLDPIIGVDLLKSFLPDENVTVVQIDGMGHAPTRANHILGVRNAIEDFVFY